MHRSMRCLPFAFSLICGSALADGSGTFFNEGKKIELSSAYAYRSPDPFDKSKEITTVVFADKPIDAATLKNASDRADALDDQLRTQKATHVDLNIESDGSVQNVNIAMPGYTGSQSGSGWYTLTLKQNDVKRIEGHFISNNVKDKTGGRFYDLKFTFDLPGASDLGDALPVGGGEAGKAYAAYQAALKNGDLDALARTMSKERAAELLTHRNDANFKMMFGFIQGQAMRDAKYVKGNASGDNATLVYTGKDGDGHASTATATMIREGGAWKLSKESTSTSVH